jgi:DNA-directed RNA polymerase specialized sigma24 family protein
MLHPWLLPVIQIERFPRICFVLRVLLGYSTALCAQILGVEERHVRMLFQMAALQLEQKILPDRVPP